MIALASIRQKLDTAKTMGLNWCVFCKGHSLLLKGLQRAYGFDPWHAINPTGCRPYKKHVADLVSALQPERVVEVGCGLGDILVKIRCSERIGIDPELAVLKAASLVHPFSSVRWIAGDLSGLAGVAGRIDVLVAIGWVHGVSPENLERLFAPHLNRIRHVVVDAFNSDANPYPYKHNFRFLESVGRCVDVSTPAADPVRRYLVYEIGDRAAGPRVGVSNALTGGS